VSVTRATGAIEDLGDLALTLFPSLRLRQRAWELRRNFTAGDALFVALAEELDEPLATKDRALAAEVNKHTGAMVLLLE
jgi:predicted nucleic acid-binding protein